MCIPIPDKIHIPAVIGTSLLNPAASDSQVAVNSAVHLEVGILREIPLACGIVRQNCHNRNRSLELPRGPVTGNCVSPAHRAHLCAHPHIYGTVSEVLSRIDALLDFYGLSVLYVLVTLRTSILYVSATLRDGFVVNGLIHIFLIVAGCQKNRCPEHQGEHQRNLSHSHPSFFFLFNCCAKSTARHTAEYTLPSYP